MITGNKLKWLYFDQNGQKYRLCKVCILQSNYVPCLLAIFLLHKYTNIMVHEKAITIIRDTATIKVNDIFLDEATSTDPGLPRTSAGGESPLQERNKASLT